MGLVRGATAAVNTAAALCHTRVSARSSSSPRLLLTAQLFLNTAVTDTNIDSTGKITSITAVQRSATQDYEPFSENLSKTLPDWYSAENSTRFTKRTLHLTGKVQP